MGENNLRSFVLLGTNKENAGDQDSLVYELRCDINEGSTGSQLGGDAPHYPIWIYNRVIIPRLLWEEAERQRQVEARQQPVSSSPEYNDIELSTDVSVRLFSSNYDFEWWLDSDSEEIQILEQDNNSKSKKDDKNLNNISTKASLPPETKHKNRNWSERFIEVKARRQKIEEEKLTRVLRKIEERKKRLENLKKV